MHLERFCVKSTQLAYPTAHFLQQQGHSTPPANALDCFDLVLGQVPAHKQIHHMRDGAVVLYRRDRSKVWQVRFKLFDRRWHRFTSKHKELTYAKRVAGEMYDRARFREEVGLPQQVKRFSVAADACLKQLDREIEQGLRPRTNNDYKQVINRYLIPFFGKYNLTSVDSTLVREFEFGAMKKLGVCRELVR